MKTKWIFALCTALLLIAGNAPAEFTLPKKVYRIAELEKAQAEAESKGKPITIIYTDETTSCGLCAGASLNAADKLGSKTVVVYVSSREGSQSLPDVVQQALRAPEAGRFIPKTVIMDAALTRLLATVPYAQSPEQDRLLKDALRSLPKPERHPALMRPAAPAPGLTSFTVPPAMDRECRIWTSQSGATLEAALVHVQNGTAALRRKDGGKVQIQCHLLSREDQDYLQSLQSASSP